MIKCEAGGLSGGQCCCNCGSQKKLMCHPMNGRGKFDKIKVGQGSICDQMGWVCTIEYGDQSNKDEYYFSDRKHGMCELWYEKK